MVTIALARLGAAQTPCHQPGCDPLRDTERTGRQLAHGVTGAVAGHLFVDLSLAGRLLNSVNGAPSTAVTESFVMSRLRCSVVSPYNAEVQRVDASQPVGTLPQPAPVRPPRLRTRRATWRSRRAAAGRVFPRPRPRARARRVVLGPGWAGSWSPVLHTPEGANGTASGGQAIPAGYGGICRVCVRRATCRSTFGASPDSAWPQKTAGAATSTDEPRRGSSVRAAAASLQILVVGEQPGDAEDKVGRPFVGPAGSVLDDALETLGLDRGRST